MMFVASATNKTVIAANGTITKNKQKTIIIDAGHGGVDSGAVSCTGLSESIINLQISLRLNSMFHLLGYKTKMIRTEDISVYTEGDTIAKKKISDLKERVRIVNTTTNAILISIHQNYFKESQYHGAQVFYCNNENSAALAELLQSNFRKFDSNNHRKHKKASGIYLLDHIECTGILIECGFISNPKEEVLLRNSDYQKNLCAVIAATTVLFLDQQTIN